MDRDRVQVAMVVALVSALMLGVGAYMYGNYRTEALGDWWRDAPPGWPTVALAVAAGLSGLLGVVLAVVLFVTPNDEAE